MDNFKKAIELHLKEVASKDELFAETLKKPSKNIDDCLTYILNEVKKSGKTAFVNDDIFNMAIHYYDEDNIEIGKPQKAKVIVTEDALPTKYYTIPEKKTVPIAPPNYTPKPTPTTAKKKEAKKKSIAPQVVQPSLFD